MSLTSDMKAGAILEANGYDAKDIAESLGLRPATVREWHKKDDYMHALEKASAEVDKQLAPLISQVRKKTALAVGDAIDSLHEQVKATNVLGDPDQETRLKAADILVKNFGKIVEPPKDREEGAGSSGPAQLVIKVGTVEEGRQIVQAQEQKRLESGGEEVVDAIAVEVD